MESKDLKRYLKELDKLGGFETVEEFNSISKGIRKYISELEYQDKNIFNPEDSQFILYFFNFLKKESN